MIEKKEGLSSDTKAIIFWNIITVAFIAGVGFAGLKWQDISFEKDMRESKATLEQHIEQTREQPVQIARLETRLDSIQRLLEDLVRRKA